MATTRDRVVDVDGVQGVIESHTVDTQDVVVRLGHRQLVIPAESMRAQNDGSYQVPFRFSDLDHDPDAIRAEGGLAIPILEEELDIHKRMVDTAKVRIHKHVHEREEVIDEPLFEDEVNIEHVPINRIIEAPLPSRVEGTTLIVPVVKEVLVVQKQLMLVEEIHVTKTRRSVRRPQSVTVRHEGVTVERVEVDQGEDNLEANDINRR
jgi:uncharacterized protein (TIGR02271 family)